MITITEVANLLQSAKVLSDFFKACIYLLLLLYRLSLYQFPQLQDFSQLHPDYTRMYLVVKTVFIFAHIKNRLKPVPYTNKEGLTCTFFIEMII